MKTLRYLMIGCLVVIFAACSDDNEEVIEPQFFIETTQLTELNVEQVKTLVEMAGLTGFDDLINQPIIIYEMTYHTTYKGQPKEASGLVGLPLMTANPIPILSVQHGTITKASKAPTLNNLYYFPFASMASANYAVVIPDFLGFGSTEEVFHPYYVEDQYVNAVFDMIQAVKEFMEFEGYTWSEKLFLAGYSEGGYATMATHKYLEENPELGYTVTASAPAAGGYDLFHMKDYFFGLVTYQNPYYMPYVIQSYNTTYDWNQSLSDFFKEPYATDIPDLFDGSLDGDEIDEYLTDTIANLLTAKFLNGFDTDPTYARLRNVMEDNSLVNWVPIASMRMYHGTDDITVPFENSELTYEKLVANGASPHTLTFIPIPGATHSTGLIPMVESVILWFEGQK